MIVIDAGCKGHEAEQSIDYLLDRFDPALLLGYDPHPALIEGVEFVGGRAVVRRKAALWIHDGGFVPWIDDGTRSRVAQFGEPHDRRVESVDIVQLVLSLPAPIVLKLDVEGGEYRVLDYLTAARVTDRLDRILVEWHREYHDADYDGLDELGCPVEEWKP